MANTNNDIPAGIDAAAIVNPLTPEVRQTERDAGAVAEMTAIVL